MINKKLVIKYQNEFRHWLSKGKLLYYETATREWLWNDNIWEMEGDYTKVQIIRDDEFVKFRKALVEGKTVQCIEYKYNYNEYRDVDYIDMSYNVQQYRIKPNEPEFKVGDWVYSNSISNNTPFLVKPYHEHIVNSAHSSQFTLWKPKKNEWCLFSTEENKKFGVGVLAKYKRQDPLDKKKFNVFGYDIAYKYCEPFIGQLPEFLNVEKDKEYEEK